MGQQTVGHKVNRELVKIATQNGARVVFGKKHIKIYDDNILVAVLSRGGHRGDTFKGGMKVQALNRFKKRGWTW